MCTSAVSEGRCHLHGDVVSGEGHGSFHCHLRRCVYNMYDGSEARNYGAEARLHGTCYSQDAPSVNRGRSWLTCLDILSLSSVEPISTSFENHFARIFGTCLIVFPSSCLQSSFSKPT